MLAPCFGAIYRENPPRFCHSHVIESWLAGGVGGTIVGHVPSGVRSRKRDISLGRWTELCAGFIRSFAHGSRRRPPAEASHRRSTLETERNRENTSAGFIRKSSRGRPARRLGFIRARRFPSFCAEPHRLRLARLPGFVRQSVSSSFGATVRVRSARRRSRCGRYYTSCQRTSRRTVSVIIIAAARGVIHRIDHFRQHDRVPHFVEAGAPDARCLKAVARPLEASGVQ